MKVNVNDNVIEFVDNLNLNETIKQTSENAFLNGRADDPFYVCDLGDILKKHTLWLQKLPRVEPYYAVKCNPNKIVLNMLAKLKIGFDCASKGEISEVINLGVSPDRIIYANPCKQVSHIKYAQSCGIKIMTFDSINELKKIYQTYPNAHLVLRIFVGATKAICPLGLKFGAQMNDVSDIFSTAKNLGLKIIGVSFHVGSGCFDASAYETAIRLSRKVFDIAETFDMNLSLLDIGGGFPGNLDSIQNAALFDDVCDTINSNLERYFPPSEGVRIIAEPGRYYVSSAFHLTCTVTSSRITYDLNAPEYNERMNYYLNDGVYGSFNCIVFDHHVCDFYLLSDDLDNSLNTEDSFSSVLWGPTCDSADKILENVKIRKISIGEKIVFKNMGAYTMAASSTFNGFQPPYIRYMADITNLHSIVSMLQDICTIDYSNTYASDFDFLFGIPSQIEAVSACARVV